VLAKAQEYHRLLQAKQGTVSLTHIAHSPLQTACNTAAANLPSPLPYCCCLCQTIPAHSAVCLDLACRLSANSAQTVESALIAPSAC
jgi:hypothetical protein